MNARLNAAGSDAGPARSIALPIPSGDSAELGAADYRTLSQCLSIFTAFAAANRAVFRTSDITAQQYACLVEAQCGGPDGRITIGDLAQRLRVRHNTAVGTVTRLCEKGHVVRTRDAKDRRKIRLELTKKGRHALDEIVRRYW